MSLRNRPLRRDVVERSPLIDDEKEDFLADFSGKEAAKASRKKRRQKAVSPEPDPFGDDIAAPRTSQKFGRQLSLRDVYFMVRERWMLGLAVAILLSGALAYWQLTRPEIFEATSEFVVELDNERVLPTEFDDQTARVDSLQEIDIHVKRLQGSAYRDHVRKQITPALHSAYIDGLLRSAKEATPFDADQRERLFSGHFDSGLNLTINRQEEAPRFVLVSYRHPTPEVAQSISNLFSGSYDAYLLAQSQVSNKGASSFLEKQVADKKSEIEKQERAIQEYRKEYGIVEESEGEDGSRTSAKVDTLDEKITAGELRLVELEIQQREVESVGGEDVLKLIQVPFIAEFGSIPGLKGELEKNQQEFDRLDLRYLARHPEMIRNRQERESILALLGDNVAVAIQDLQNTIEKVQTEQGKLREALEGAATEHLNSGDPIVEYRVMQRGLELERSAYDLLLKRLNETQISGELETSQVKVTEIAGLPHKPVEPDQAKTIKQVSLLFLACLFGVPIGIGFLDTRLKSFGEAESYLGKEGLGVVGERKSLSAQELGQCVLRNIDEELVESFRVIYSSALLKSHAETPKMVVVASSGPGEGKSFVTANLAAMYARHQNRVLIIDCDLRKPSQHRLLGLRNREGILKWYKEGRVIPKDMIELQGNESLGLVALSDDLPFFLLRAGGSTRDPSEILSSPDFEDLLAALQEMFDVIFLDSPPVDLFADALLLTHVADESIFVCKHNGVNRHRIKLALDKMDHDHGQCPVLGLVLNQLSTSRRHQYDYYSYKNYGSYYRDEEEDDEEEKT